MTIEFYVRNETFCQKDGCPPHGAEAQPNDVATLADESAVFLWSLQQLRTSIGALTKKIWTTHTHGAIRGMPEAKSGAGIIHSYISSWG